MCSAGQVNITGVATGSRNCQASESDQTPHHFERTDMTEQLATRPPFKVSGMATIKHLNVRKEGPEDDKILAVDVKLEIKNVDRRLCGYFDDALEAFLWRGDTNALIARNAFLTPVRYANEISSASVSIGNNSYSGCDVKKFEIEPRDGGVITLTCSVAVYPNSADVSDLAKMVQDEAGVTIEGPPDLFAGDPQLNPLATESELANPFPLDGGSEPVVDPFTPELAFAAAHAEAPAE